MENKKINVIMNVFLIKENYTKEEDILNRDISSIKKREVKFRGAFIGNLYIKPSHRKKPYWIDLFEDTNIPDLDNLEISSASAVLLVKQEGRIFSIVFGYGRHLLNQSAIEERFGLKTALNSIIPDTIRSIDRRVVDNLSRYVRENVNRDTNFRSFGFDVEQDLLSAITGMSSIESLGTRLTGRDNLITSKKMNLPDILPFLSTAYIQYKKNKYQDEFGWIDNIKDISDPIIIDRLNDLLVQEVRKGKQTDKIWLAIPVLIDWARVSGFRFSQSDKHEINTDLYISDFIKTLMHPARLNINTLRSKRAYCYDRETEQPIFHWSVYRCLCFEVELEGNTYILNDGKWYRINPDFVATVDTYVKSIKESEIQLPEYNHNSEGEYNDTFVELAPEKYVLMHEKLIMYGGGYSRIEFCDIFSKDGHIIHVKKYGSSSVLSHLFAQGGNSAEILLMDANFRKKLHELLPESHKHLVTKMPLDPKKFEIAYCIVSISKKDLKIPFFSRVNLRNWSRRLNGLGYNVTLSKIIFGEK